MDSTKLFKIEHIPTGLFYREFFDSRYNRTNLSNFGRIFKYNKPKISDVINYIMVNDGQKCLFNDCVSSSGTGDEKGWKVGFHKDDWRVIEYKLYPQDNNYVCDNCIYKIDGIYQLECLSCKHYYGSNFERRER